MNKNEYAAWVSDTIRYGDTDAQGHVNNAVFSIYLETGRTTFLLGNDRPIKVPGTTFVIAKLILDFKAEMHWPGETHVGTRVKSIGRSSFVLEQVIMQGETITATAESVLVMMNEKTRKSHPLPDSAIARLKEMQVIL